MPTHTTVSDNGEPHPRPIEGFLGTHPRALKFVQDPKPTPTSYVTEHYFANNAFRFVDKEGVKRAGRYQILPAGGTEYLAEAEAKARVAVLDLQLMLAELASPTLPPKSPP